MWDGARRACPARTHTPLGSLHRPLQRHRPTTTPRMAVPAPRVQQARQWKQHSARVHSLDPMYLCLAHSTEAIRVMCGLHGVLLDGREKVVRRVGRVEVASHAPQKLLLRARLGLGGHPDLRPKAPRRTQRRVACGTRCRLPGGGSRTGCGERGLRAGRTRALIIPGGMGLPVCGAGARSQKNASILARSPPHDLCSACGEERARRAQEGDST